MARYAFQMANPIKDGKIFQMANPERVTQHEALWPEVPLDTIEA